MEHKETNLTEHRPKVTKEDRTRLNGHRSFILWFTGLSGSGKSTIAHRLEERLFEIGVRTYVLDGDNVRTGLNKGLGFSAEDREENIRRIGHVAKLFVDAGLVVLTAFISPYKKDRATARSLVGSDEFVEIYVKCHLEICERRDTKGLYEKARRGVVKQFTGIDDPYEEPEHPEIVLETDKVNLEQCVGEILNFLKAKRFVSCVKPVPNWPSTT
jgi:adenylylsulfate kinase